MERDELEGLAKRYERKTPNPWPADSDYGKLWLRGYRAGASDANGKNVAAALRSHINKEGSDNV